MRSVFLPVFAAFLACFCLCGCGGASSSNSAADGDTLSMSYAKYLTLVDHGDYTTAVFTNPWDTTKSLQTLVLVDRDSPLPENLPAGTVIRTPISNSIVYTSAHNNILYELGAIDAVSGACDTKYIISPELQKRVNEGSIADCGQSTAPNIEKILMLQPEAILLSAFENSNDHNKVDQMGIPIIDCIDHMETSPLGRAEWVKLYGMLYGKKEVADSIFAATESAYNEIKTKVGKVEKRPKVLTDLIYGQSWSMPGALSTMGILIEDAGGCNPFDEYKKSGGVLLSPEEVLFKANDADVWLIRYAQAQPLTINQIGKDNAVYTKFKPYSTGNVYGCNTLKSTFFDDSAFHPDWILAEYVNLLHPEIDSIAWNHHYFTKLER